MRGWLAAAAVAALVWGARSAHCSTGAAALYPAAPHDGTVDTYHGTKVPDPYRPLEDPDSAVTGKWVQAENKVTFGYLEKIAQRNKIRQRLTDLWNYEKFGVPTQEGGRLFSTYNPGLLNQAVLNWADGPDGKPQLLLDPNTLAKDGTVALSGTIPSKDGKLLAYGVAAAGSDWNDWKVRDVDSGKDRPDLIKWVKFSQATWTPDGKGFFYGRFPQPKQGEDLKGANYYQKLCYHQLGTSQEKDSIVWEDPEHKDWRADPTVTDDGHYLLVTLSKGTDDKYRVLYRPLDKATAPLVHLAGDFDADYSFVDNDGDMLWFRTNKDAPRGKLIAIDLHKPQPEHWVSLIPEGKDTLVGVTAVGGHFLASYLKDAHTAVREYDLKGTFLREISFPGLGTATGFTGKLRQSQTFYSFTSFTTPTTVYRYDVASGKSSIWREPKLNFKPGDYETTQSFFNSKDGTKIPIFLTHKRGMKLDTNTPALLYGYGGFNIAITPNFSPSTLTWLEMGGLFAVANLRGGGEYGESWHQAGTKLNKQNVFDDFISAAEWLINSKYTSRAKLAIEGRSNGGLLVGACMTQRPDLYGACLPGVGVMDMLRFHRFTIGWAWKDDYGSSDNPEQFRAIRKYSPLHNIKPGTCYPPTMITTADHDDRVVPAHSFKFAATLQAAQGCDQPVLIRIDTRAGHGAGKPTAKLIEEAADKWAFLVNVLGVTVH